MTQSYGEKPSKSVTRSTYASAREVAPGLTLQRIGGSAKKIYLERRRGGVSTARQDAWEGSGATLGQPAGWDMQARHGASKGSRVI